MNGDIESAISNVGSDAMVISTDSMDAFEADLARRAKVPAPKLDELMQRDEATIAREAEAVAAILKRFARAVVASMDDPGGVDQFLRELDLKAISRDHDWRTIFAELRDRDDRFEQHKRILVIKYLQYLSFRKKLLDYIHERKLGLEETAQHPDLTIFPAPSDPSRASAVGASRPLGEFSRVPVGETVAVTLPSSGSVEFMLARRMFRLIGPANPCLVDQNGDTHFLKKGRNMMGRHPESDVVIDPDFNDVSRAHAIVEWRGDHQVLITDLSTRGTFVPVEVMRAARIVLNDD
jgi:hypothetical protein